MSRCSAAFVRPFTIINKVIGTCDDLQEQDFSRIIIIFTLFSTNVSDTSAGRKKLYAISGGLSIPLATKTRAFPPKEKVSFILFSEEEHHSAWIYPFSRDNLPSINCTDFCGKD